MRVKTFGIFGVILMLLAAPMAKKAFAQRFFSPIEFGLQLGASTYYGDLNTNWGLHYLRPAGGAYVRYYFNPYIALRGMVNYTKVGYDDAFSKDPFHKIRNLSFRSDILEAAVVGEFNFFRFQTGDKYHRFTPFLAGGIGAFYYNPYRRLDGKRYNLRAIGTEGQNTGLYDDRIYKSYSLCFPVGVGVKYWVGPGLNFSFELMNRFTLTDYLDDVSNTYVGVEHFAPDPMHPTPAAYLQDPSIPIDGQKLGRAGKQRGDNASKDQYLMATFSISFQFKTYKCPTNYYDAWSDGQR